MSTLRNMHKPIPAPSIQDAYVGGVLLAAGVVRRFMR
jgi:hypothetical protein